MFDPAEASVSYPSPAAEGRPMNHRSPSKGWPMTAEPIVSPVTDR